MKSFLPRNVWWVNNIVCVSYIVKSVLGGGSRVNMMNGRLVVLCLAASGLGAGVATICVIPAYS